MRAYKKFFSLTVLALIGPMLAAPGTVEAGGYIFAGEANGVDLILHPQGYTGTQNVLTVEVCINPATLVPAGAVITDMEIPVQNNIAIWNQLHPIVGNSLLSTANNIPPGELDFEAVAVHELGHCIGLAHVNAASESALPGNDTNYTKATNGIDNFFNLDPGVDGVRGTLDDQRGDDVNLHWFRIDTNDPGQLPLPVPVDNTTYDRDQSSLPAGHDFAQNLDRTAAGVMGHPSTFPVNTEAVMQQGTFSDEDQRRTTADGVGTILLGMSGADETAGTADDYVINLVYGGISAAGSCNLSLSFTAMGGLAFCSVGGVFIPSPPGTTHASITTGFMEYGVGFNWFFNQDGPCRQTFDLTTGQWKQIALSCEPPAGADTVADLFGDDLTGTYDVNWVVYRRDATIPAYIKLALTDVLTVGQGYWIKTNQASQTVNIEDQFNGNADTALLSDPAGRPNMVGHRYWYDEAWNDVRVVDGANVLTLAQADPAGACQGPNPLANGCVMSRIAHKWNGAAYDAFDGQTPGMEGTLENFDGFWVRAYKPGIELRIPDQRSTPAAPNTELLSPVRAARGGGPAATREPARAAAGDAAPEGWYVRLIAESGDLRDAGNVLGELPDSSEGYDGHDLIELDPFGDEYLTIVFPHSEWGERAGRYTSDYRELNASRARAWHFQVRSSNEEAEVVLRWEGDSRQLERAILIDVDADEEMLPQPGGSYAFTMEGATRNFAWVIR